MSFLLACPNCGPRGVYEFRYGGEYKPRPAGEYSAEQWVAYLYVKTNTAGVQQEWWFHRQGCQRWFKAERDTRTNAVRRTYWQSAESAEPDQSAAHTVSAEQ